jgi:hypothetical protein
MARGKLFEYGVLFHPKPKKDASGNEEPVKSKIVTDVTRVLATTPEEVSIMAARSIPEEYLGRLDEVEITIRPF